jgi:hypothetical protein
VSVTVPAALGVTLLTLWVLASAVTQVRRPSAQRPRRYDYLGLLPAWNFFAPRPITCDFQVRYREWSDEAGLSGWRPLELPRERTITDVVLNPTRREKKAMFEACARVVKSFTTYHPDEDAVMISMSYLLILGRVSAEVAGADAVQFGIWLTEHNAGDPRQVFRSALHALDGAAPDNRSRERPPWREYSCAP